MFTTIYQKFKIFFPIFSIVLLLISINFLITLYREILPISIKERIRLFQNYICLVINIVSYSFNHLYNYEK